MHESIGETAVAARFLLGGIGAGNVSLNQNGRLVDFELFNTPNKGFPPPYTFFSVRTEGPDGQVRLRALESKWQPPYDLSHGYNAWNVGRLPRFAHSTMTGEYPFVRIGLFDDAMPIEAELTAFTPFIPLNADDSSLPCAILRYAVKNTSRQPLAVSVAGSFANVCGLKEFDIWGKPLFQPGSRNAFVDEGTFRGIHFSVDGKTADELSYMDMAFVTTERDVSHLEHWNEGAWWDGLQDFWNDFARDGELTNGRTLRGQGNRIHKSDIDVSSLCVKKRIQPGDTQSFGFLLTWHRPNRVRSWRQLQDVRKMGRPLVRNYRSLWIPTSSARMNFWICVRSFSANHTS